MLRKEKGESGKRLPVNSLSNISAHKLAAVAIAIWLCSLVLPGIDLYSQPDSQRHRLVGIEILAMGWLSPSMANFAWFANIFFLYGFFQLKSGNAPIKSSIAAALLSLDTFRFDQYPLNEAGSTTPVYGYGWGAVLWFLSISLLLTAAGKRQLETRVNPERSTDYEWLQSFGVFLAVAMLGTTGYFAIHDRIVANPAEAQRLAGIAFKRGTICHAPEPVAAEPLRNFSGTLEVVMDKNRLKTSNADYPFRQIKSLLAWGIPTVRFYGKDFSYDLGLSNGEVISIPASGAPTAILYINGTASGAINAKLVEVVSGRIVFDQTWEKEKLPEKTNFHFCPDYRSFPRVNEQPRRLLTQALDLPTLKEQPDQEHQQSTSITSIDGLVIGDAEGGLARKTRFEKWKRETNPGFKFNSAHRELSSAEYHELFNTNCPRDIGWDGSNRDTQQHMGWAFMVNGKAYYPISRSGPSYATCADGIAYLYIGGMRNDGKYYLNIVKRTLPEFRQIWAGIVLIPNIPSTTRDNVLEIQSVREEDESMTIKLVHEGTGKILLVQAPVHNKTIR